MCGTGSPAQTTLLGSPTNIGGSQGPIMSSQLSVPTPKLPITAIPDSDSNARLSLATQALSTVSSTAGAFAKAQSEAQAAKINSDLAASAAINEQRVGDSQAQKLFQQTSQIKGTQRASFAARGLDLGTGSPLDILTSTDIMGGQDQATLKTNTQQNINADLAKAAYYKSQASNSSPFIAAGASLIGGAGKVADKWYDFKKAGNFTDGFFGNS